MNFSSWYKPNLGCPLGCRIADSGEVPDDEGHLLTCIQIQAELTPEQLTNTRNINYIDIYNNAKHQKQAAKVFSLVLEVRERLMSAAVSASGQSLDAAPSPGGTRESYIKFFV